ncbi:hypothetical protein OIU84_012921 [Salix udensis]|uniref:Uncharacterized protein n=1 Tax=Salix udensis TaxID=889485 RepID=A0AAD6JGS9_9ROSI|nr:hypothetical protein OIU84_012921 [Salix udensis]
MQFALLAVSQICRVVRPSIPSSYVPGFAVRRALDWASFAPQSSWNCLQIYCDTLCSSDPPPYPCRSDKSRVGRPAKISDSHLLLHFLCFSRSASSVLFIVADRKRGK